jgi:hypothetical protein
VIASKGAADKWVVAYYYQVAWLYQAPSFNPDTIVSALELFLLNRKGASQWQGEMILWVNADAEDHQLECVKDGMVFPKKNMKRSWKNIKRAQKRNEYGKELEYNSSLGSSDFRFLLFDLFRSNHVQQWYRFLGWLALGHNGHGNSCTGYCFLDGNNQMATPTDQEVEPKAKQKERKHSIIGQDSERVIKQYPC